VGGLGYGYGYGYGLGHGYGGTIRRAMRTCPECQARTEAPTCRSDGCPTLSQGDVDAPAVPEVGQLVAGKFRVLEPIGRGGMSVVFRAWQRDMRRVVALKLANANPDDPAGTRRFLREVQMAAGLTHPNTIRIFDYGELPDGRLFFTMEFLEGEPLGRAVRRGDVFDDLRVVRIAAQVLKALGEAHAAAIVHRDLSPDNVFLVRLFGETDHVKVLDFGVAKGARYELSEDERLTTQGMFVGKPAFASPEQAEGIEDIDGRSDLYTLGIVMYQMIAGQVPFQSATPMQVLIAQIRDDPAPIGQVARRPVHPELAAFVMRLLSKQPADRPPSAPAALAELERIGRRIADPAAANGGDASAADDAARYGTHDRAALERARALAGEDPAARDLGWIDHVDPRGVKGKLSKTIPDPPPRSLGKMIAAVVVAAVALALGAAIGLGWGPALFPSEPPAEPAVDAPVSPAVESPRVEPAAEPVAPPVAAPSPAPAAPGGKATEPKPAPKPSPKPAPKPKPEPKWTF